MKQGFVNNVQIDKTKNQEPGAKSAISIYYCPNEGISKIFN